MTFLPIVERELRVRARHAGTYKARGTGATLAVGVTFVLLMFGATGANAGASAFSLLSFLAFGFCLFEGLRNTTDSLSEEKRAGTLGFLFLTDLKGYDVVLGKMIAASLNSVYVLIAVLPAFALPLLAGGVTAGEFWRLVLLLLEALLFSLALGILVSSASRDETSAWLASAGLMLTWAIVPIMVRSLPFISFSFVDWLGPSTAFASFREAAFKANAAAYWASVAGTAILGVLFVAAASWILPRAWQDKPRELSALTRDVLPQAARHASDAADQRVLNQNPVVWLTSRGQTRQQIYLWLLVCIGGSIAVVASLNTIGWGAVTFVFIIAAVALHLILATLVAFNACYLVSDAKHSGALELLFSTPLKPQQIVDGFLLGIKRRFFWPVVTLLWVEIALLLVRVLAAEGEGAGALILFLLGGAVIVMFVMDLYAVAIFGMWTALHAKKAGTAFGRTITLVLILPTLLGMCCFVLPVTGIIKNIIFLSYRQALYDKFRRMISEPHGADAPVGLRARMPPNLPSVLD